MEDKVNWIGFNLIKGIGTVRMQGLAALPDEGEFVWKVSPVDLAGAGLGKNVSKRLVQARESVDLEKLWDKIEKQSIQFLTWEDELYPQWLKEIDQRLQVLYIRGECLPDGLFEVAIVTMRCVTLFGRWITGELSSFLAPNGMTVISYGSWRGFDYTSNCIESWQESDRCVVLQVHHPMRPISHRSIALFQDYHLQWLLWKREKR